MLARHERAMLFLPLAALTLPFLIGPALAGLLYSFTSYAPGQPRIQWLGLHNFATAARDPLFQAAWNNMTLFALGSLVGGLVIGFALAYLLRAPFRGRGLVRVGLLLPWLVSPIASGVMWHFLFNLQMGILNYFRAWFGLAGLPSPLGLASLALSVTIAINIWRIAPLAGFLLLPGLLAIPRTDWEIAELEGAPLFSRIWQIALPRLRPLMLAVGLLLCGDALGAFDSILILTGGGPGRATMLPALYSYQQAFQAYNWPAGATSAWFIVLAVALIGAAYLWLDRGEVD